MKHSSTIRAALSVLLSICALLQYRIIRLQLPALHSAPLADAISFLAPPLVLALGAILQRSLPPMCFIPLVIYPSLSACVLPVAQLLCLSLLTALVICSSKTDFVCACITSLFLFILDAAVHSRLSHVWLFKVLKTTLPSLTFAIAMTHFATRSVALNTLRLSRDKRARRKKKSLPIMYSLVMVFLASLLVGQLPPFMPPPPLPKQYTLLAQSRGPTGLISVVEKRGEYRMLLADLSVLGGYFDASKYYPDSIFSQFYVQEAVRLVGQRKDNATALCIGLGIGVAANALSKHGVKVTAVDIDPIVALYARKYFGLQIPVQVEDAVSYVTKLPIHSYDYVIHDVFTGGTMPSALFSVQMFEHITRLLKPEGVLAVNFVGATELPPTPASQALSLVSQRMKNVFGKVRAFSDGLDARMHNIVMFTSTGEGAVVFREPDEQDFLGSSMRRTALTSFQEHELGEDQLKGCGDSSSVAWVMYRGLLDIAEAHRKLMYNIHPKQLWPAMLAAEKWK